ncbi:GNAT family protein [Candidatus Villigracilis saccharophilus]|uniref:GNAT family N-acetyltransferase n=1 Tax=Candidatus Villigracilis saccharophilus TaxID=3140684 RepID=UPI003135936A|nr:GNAT family N-acetyltransferase [Anaerolineales bacterium]
MKDIYRGTLVRLSDDSPELLAKAFARWDRDTEQHRLADSDPAQLWSEKKIKEFQEKRAETNSKSFRFSIHSLDEDKLIGGVGLWISSWTHAETWLGISIGERDYWGRGYGTDAMRLAVQYAFLELGLRRVSLGLHAYNERALKSYQKVGFKLEGRMRGEGLRDGVRYDSLWMGILREEWLALAETK